MDADTSIEELARHARNAVLEQHFPSFVQKCFSTLNPATQYLANWHIELIAEYLEACRRGEIRRLIINMPPRALKSLCVSVAWPAFLLGHNPASRIMTASYASGLSIRHALDCRRLLQSPWYQEVFPDTRLAHDQNEKHKFATTAYGYRYATSVGGSATGEGGDFLIVDDPQNPAQVMSETQRLHAIEWFDHTFATRLDDKRRGVIVVVMQRLHDEDLSRHLLAKGGWEHLCLPAIAEKEEWLVRGTIRHKRKTGDVLHPQREDLKMLHAMQRELGSFGFAAQYQQNPLPMTAGMVQRQWFLRYGKMPECDRIVQSWDTAIKAGGGNDCSACITFGQKNNMHFVLDVTTCRAEYPELKRMVAAHAEQWKAATVLIEDKASGQSLLQDLRRELTVPLVAVLPKHDKVTRLATVSAMVEAGQVSLPKEAVWLAGFESELLAFPRGKRDDQVDAFSQYLGWVRERSGAGSWRIRGL